MIYGAPWSSVSNLTLSKPYKNAVLVESHPVKSDIHWRKEEKNKKKMRALREMTIIMFTWETNPPLLRRGSFLVEPLETRLVGCETRGPMSCYGTGHK